VLQNLELEEFLFLEGKIFSMKTLNFTEELEGKSVSDNRMKING